MKEYTVEADLPCTFHTVVEADSPEAAVAKAKRTFRRDEWWLNVDAVAAGAKRSNFRVAP
jgi:hypothetical protein